MACSLLDPIACLPSVPSPVGAVGGSILDTVLSGLSSAIGDAVKSMVAALSSWIFIPTDPVCSTPVPDGGVVSGDWVGGCQHSPSAAATLNSYVLPITVLVAVFGVLWQAIVMVISRRGEPLLQVIRGLWNTALWGAVGIAGTQLALHASDSFATWILASALHGGSPGPSGDAFTAALSSMLVTQLPSLPVLAILVGFVIIIVLLIQTVLMIFRDAAIAILAGLLQLAAAGSFTQATSPWKGKVAGWAAALIAYKPAAALCYAAGLAFMSDHSSTSNFLVGLAVLALSVVALPALMKFFTWTVGSIQSGGSSLGMFGAGAAAGVHAAASLRALGGNSAAEHSRYMSDHGPGTGVSGSGGGGTPTGAAAPVAPRPSGSSGGGTGQVIDGGSGVAGPTTPGAPAMATTTALAGTGATDGAAGGATAASATASGPAAPVVLGAVVVAQAATKAAQSAADSTSDSTGGA